MGLNVKGEGYIIHHQVLLEGAAGKVTQLMAGDNHVDFGQVRWWQEGGGW